MKTKTIPTRRHYPAKPVKAVPEQQTGTVNRENALSILKDFYLEAKKEITGATVVSINQNSEVCNLSFVCDEFDLKLNFTGGRAAV